MPDRDWHPRSDWTGYAPTFTAFPRPANGIAIHHAASSYPQAFDPGYLRAQEASEMARGYDALAYHCIVFADGSLAESRPYWAYGAATGGHNDHTIAFCYAGYFHPDHYDVPTDAAVRACGEEIARLVEWGFLTPDYVVRPHRDWTYGTQWATACPGDLLTPRVPEIDAISRNPTPPPDPVPAPRKAPPTMTVMCINFNGVNAYLVQGGIIVHQFTGPPGPPEYGSIPKDATEFSNDTGCGLAWMSGGEWAALLKRSGVT